MVNIFTNYSRFLASIESMKQKIFHSIESLKTIDYPVIVVNLKNTVLAIQILDVLKIIATGENMQFDTHALCDQLICQKIPLKL